ncbi:hypothetical protein MTR_3g096490 [Medicago truncatula]|uniref:Uncharacterized protein n=1 Tax=Medicago truncatula TaxID=3880 RepID=G7JC42_MEDTR|nr:hypothetical protein MTR_3g096490 [Medicago truncatula]
MKEKNVPTQNLGLITLNIVPLNRSGLAAAVLSKLNLGENDSENNLSIATYGG